jgi:hsp70-interacting protein
MAAEPEDNWAWLGLLKWSLTYVDGTVPSEDSPDFQQMSEEDKKFLEEVMQNGVINEGDRLKTILNQCVAYLDSIKDDGKKEPVDGESAAAQVNQNEEENSNPIPSEEEVKELLQEVQDIIGQIDFAKSFAAIGGIPFLIGCASQTNTVPQSVRAACLAVLGTLCQNNPSVQYTMLEQGNIPKLINIFFAEYVNGVSNGNGDSSSPVQVRAVQAMSCFIRNHDVAEKIFCMNQEGKKMINCALGIYSQTQESTQTNGLPLPAPSTSLRSKALFFLQALLTSDSSDQERIRFFTDPIQYVATYFLDPNMEADSNIRETALSMLTRIMDQKKGVNAILDVKNSLVGLGVKRVAEMRALEGEEKDYVEEELRLWEKLITEVARGIRDESNPDTQAPLAIAAGEPNLEPLAE